MKATKLKTAMALLISLSAAPAFADKKEALQGARSSGTFFGGAAIGAAAGGPIGLFVGSVAGALLGEHFNKHDENKASLEESYINLSVMTEEIETQDLEISKLEKMIQEKIEFQMYFDTGKDELSTADLEQLDSLATFLVDNPNMNVVVEGHADPRGTDSYNRVLSTDRANSVATPLIENGVGTNRIQVQGYGSEYSKGESEDLSDYANERKVKVHIYPELNSDELVTID